MTGNSDHDLPYGVPPSPEDDSFNFNNNNIDHDPYYGSNNFLDSVLPPDNTVNGQYNFQYPDPTAPQNPEYPYPQNPLAPGLQDVYQPHGIFQSQYVPTPNQSALIGPNFSHPSNALGLGQQQSYSNVGANVQEPLGDNILQHQGHASIQDPPAGGLQGPITVYRNDILSLFKDPTIALRVIDEYYDEFPDDLVLRLSKSVKAAKKSVKWVEQPPPSSNVSKVRTDSDALSRSGSVFRASRGRPQTPSALAAADAVQNNFGTPNERTRTQISSVAIPQGKKHLKSRRTERIESLDPTQLYDSLPGPPETWHAYRNGERATEFKYNIHGELNPKQRFSAAELADYFDCHPLHSPTSCKDSRFILYLQKVPADSASRYPSKSYGDKCRWDCCQSQSLRTGEFRVALYEIRWEDGFRHNPFHCAGYVHLYCLERMFNIISLYNKFRLEPDLREFHGDKAPKMMALNRDGDGIINVFYKYMERIHGEAMVEEAKSTITAKSSTEWFEKSLTRALTEWHVLEGKKNTQKQASDRRGYDLSKHYGDLEEQARYKIRRKEEKKEEAKKGLKGSKKRKHPRHEFDLGNDEDNESGDEDDSDENTDDENENETSRRVRRKSGGSVSQPHHQSSKRPKNSISSALGETSLGPRTLRSSNRLGSPATSPKSQPSSHHRNNSNAHPLSFPSNSPAGTKRSLRNANDTTTTLDAPQRSPTRTSPRLAKQRQQEAAPPPPPPQAPQEYQDLDDLFGDGGQYDPALFDDDAQFDFIGDGLGEV